MMVVNLKMQMESYSNDQLVQTLSDTQGTPDEIIQMAKSIVLARGLSHRNIMDRIRMLHFAKSEAAAFMKNSKPVDEIVAYVCDKYFLEEEVAQKLVLASEDFDNKPAMIKCFGYFVSGILLFYAIRIFTNVV